MLFCCPLALVRTAISKRDRSALSSKHQPESVTQPILFAAVRSKNQKELFWRCSFVACERARNGSPHEVFQRHHPKEQKEQLFSEVLSGLDLHLPPCAELIANQVYYALAPEWLEWWRVTYQTKKPGVSAKSQLSKPHFLMLRPLSVRPNRLTSSKISWRKR